MNLFQKQQDTIRYNSITDAIADDDTAAVPLGTTIVPRPATTTMTRGHRATLWMAIVAAGMLLVTGVAVLRPDRATAVVWVFNDVATTDFPNRCVPAEGAFGGVSTTSDSGESDPFETCYQYNGETTYCWTKSWGSDLTDNGPTYYQCVPDGGGKAWKAIDAQYVNPVTQPNSCGPPCQGQHECSDDDFF